MNRRITWQLILGFIGLLPHLGCLSWINRTSQYTPPPLDGSPKKEKREEYLPPDKSGKACLTTARTLQANGHLKQAATQYELARLYDPNLKGISRRLAVLYDQLGKHRKAEAEYEKALKETPEDTNLLSNYGFFHHNRGQWKKAEELFRQALQIEPKNRHAWNNLGLVLAIQGKYPESVQAYKNVVSEAEAFNNIAFVLQAQKKFEEAKHAYRTALELEPGWQEVRIKLEKLEQADLNPKKPLPQTAPEKTMPEPLPPPRMLPNQGNKTSSLRDANPLPWDAALGLDGNINLKS